MAGTASNARCSMLPIPAMTAIILDRMTTFSGNVFALDRRTKGDAPKTTRIATIPISIRRVGE